MNSLDIMLGKTPEASRYGRSSVFIRAMGEDVQSDSSNGFGNSDSETERLRTRIEYLERERKETLEKLHEKEEHVRSYKIQGEKWKKMLEMADQEKNEILATKSRLEDEIFTVESERNELSVKIKSMQSSLQEPSGASWTQMTISTRELQRVKEELNNLKEEKLKIATEKSELVVKIEEQEKKMRTQEERYRLLGQTLDEYKCKISLLENKTVDYDILKYKNTKGEEELKRLTMELVEKRQQLDREADKNHGLEEELRSQHEELEEVKSKLTSIQKSLEADSNGTLISSDILGNAERGGLIQELSKKLLQSEKERRKLLNKLQDLKGSIRVFVRCRPFLPGDGEKSSDEKYSESSVHCGRDGNTVAVDQHGSAQKFMFDHVFRPESTQEDVYHEVEDLVQSAMDGYKVCIFSYGQTGSGKTHTMTGSREGQERGIIPRAVEELLKRSQSMENEGWKIELQVSLVEIYNEEVKDLLATKNSQSSKIKILASQQQSSTSTLSSTLVGVNTVKLPSHNWSAGMKEVNVLMDQAMKARTTACTGMNERSSRSHVIFFIDIQGFHSQENTVLQGGLRLCDLAGSERVHRAGTQSEANRFKESVHINQSLTSLASVFHALQKKASHVPYRNSKLTLLLQDCLSGEGKALMVVNISPTMASSSETLCSLKFAAQVNQVEMGKAQKNIAMISSQVMKSMATPNNPPLLTNPSNALPHSGPMLTSSTAREGTQKRAPTSNPNSNSTSTSIMKNHNHNSRRPMKRKAGEIVDYQMGEEVLELTNKDSVEVEVDVDQERDEEDDHSHIRGLNESLEFDLFSPSKPSPMDSNVHPSTTTPAITTAQITILPSPSTTTTTTTTAAAAAVAATSSISSMISSSQGTTHRRDMTFLSSSNQENLSPRAKRGLLPSSTFTSSVLNHESGNKLFSEGSKPLKAHSGSLSTSTAAILQRSRALANAHNSVASNSNISTTAAPSNLVHSTSSFLSTSNSMTSSLTSSSSASAAAGAAVSSWKNASSSNATIMLSQPSNLTSSTSSFLGPSSASTTSGLMTSFLPPTGTTTSKYVQGVESSARKRPRMSITPSALPPGLPSRALWK